MGWVDDLEMHLRTEGEGAPCIAVRSASRQGCASAPRTLPLLCLRCREGVLSSSRRAFADSDLGTNSRRIKGMRAALVAAQVVEPVRVSSVTSIDDKP